MVYAVDEIARTVSIIAFDGRSIIWSDELKAQGMDDTAYNNCIIFLNNYNGADYSLTVFGNIEADYEPSFATSNEGWCLASEYEFAAARAALGDALLKSIMTIDNPYWLSTDVSDDYELAVIVNYMSFYNDLIIGSMTKSEELTGMVLVKTFNIDQL